MLEWTLKRGVVMRKAVDAVMAVCKKHLPLVFTPEGLSLQGMDEARVALVTLELKAEEFTQYRCDKEELEVGLSADTFMKVLKLCREDDTITFTHADQSSTVEVEISSPNRKTVAAFSLKVLDADAEHLFIPENDYAATARVPALTLSKVVREMSALGELVEVTMSQGRLHLKVSSETTQGSMTLSSSADGSVRVEAPPESDKVSETFPFRYFQVFAKAVSLGNSVYLSLNAEQPLRAEFRLASTESAENDMGRLRYFLAPKMDR